MATVTQDQFDLAYIRRSAEDHKRIMDALKADGTLSIVAGDEIIDPPAQLDAEGNEVKDEEGNTVYEAAQVNQPTELEIETDNVPEENTVVIPDDYVVEVAPGTQNAAAPFPEESKAASKSSRSRAKETQEA